MVHGHRGPGLSPVRTRPGRKAASYSAGHERPEAAHSMHLSTGLIGAQHRYLMMIKSQQLADEETARDTITRAVNRMLPGRRQ